MFYLFLAYPTELGPITITTDIAVDQCSPDLTSPSSSTQTSLDLSANSPRKQKCKKRIRQLSHDKQQLMKKVEDMQNILDDVVEHATLDVYKKLTNKFCESKELANFINLQVSQATKHPKGRRFSAEYKNDCLAMYYTGPKLYKKKLMNLFCLPSPQTLFKLVRGVQIDQGLNNPRVFEILKLKVNCFEEQSKFCVLCVDEMYIKANLFYDRSSDSIIGLAENEEGVRFFKPALNVSVLMLRGLFSKWKQPLAYFFSNKMFPANSLKNVIYRAIAMLQEIGLKVTVLVSDMGSNNLQLAKMLGVTSEHPYFFVNEQKVVYIFDIPHILKAIRNNLIKHDYVHENKRISWDFVKSFYDNDKMYPIRAAPKLTDSHINPSGFEKMKVKFASQIFSATVSAGISLFVRFGVISAEAITTAEFIDKVDKLFDLLNSSKTSSTKKMNAAFKGLPYQIDFLKECLNFFNNLKVFNHIGEDITNKIKCFKCLITSIKAILNLWITLEEVGFNYLFTRRLNQDCLENFFGSVRQQNGNCKNPTSIQFKRTFKKLLCMNLFHSGTENCEADPDEILLRLCDTSEGTPLETVTNPSQTNIRIDTDYQTNELLQKNFVTYICGYLMKKALNKHTCETCENFAKAQSQLDDSLLFCYFKAYECANRDVFGKLNVPHESFIYLISSIEILFQENFQNIITGHSIGATFFNKVCESFSFNHPCKTFPIEYVIKLYIRTRIYFSLKNINRNFIYGNKDKLIIWKHQ